MKIIEEEICCEVCNDNKIRLKLEGHLSCYENICCDCCKKKGLQKETCKLISLELELIKKEKKLNENEKKGISLERAMSDTLDNLGIPHKRNPFNLCYSSFQVKNPDIVIEELSGIIECKNLSKKERNSLSTEWLDKNIICRPKTSGYNLKMALFSYKPTETLIKYLKRHGWKTYGVGFQLLNEKQERKAVRKLKQQFWWLKKLYDQIHNE